VNWQAVALAVPVGLLASAILVVNNVRDIDTDRRAGKNTLAVRLGRERTRTLFAVMVLAAFPVALIPTLFGEVSVWALLSWLTLPLALQLIKTVRSHSDGPTLNDCLAKTGQVQLLFCILLSVGILL
jgi:1,4-dihydroxy-2-naphthoate octaprenyltransferase